MGKKYKSCLNGDSAEDRALNLFADMLIDKMEQIQSDWKKPWFCEGSSGMMPQNLNGRLYNGGNAFMLFLYCEEKHFKFPCFGTFDRFASMNFTVTENGRVPAVDADGNKLPLVSVLKGEQSFPVMLTTFLCVNKESREKISYDDYKELSQEEREKFEVYPINRVYYVFNIDQTNLKDSRPDLYNKITKGEDVKGEFVSEEFHIDKVDDMISNQNWICPINEKHGDDAYYSISKKEIVMPERTQFFDQRKFYGNLFHEMAHSTGSEEYLNRLKPASFGSSEYAKEELVAEMTAALTSARFGIDKNIKEDSVPYLKSWLSSLKEDKSFIKTLLSDVKKASALISKHVEVIE